MKLPAGCDLTGWWSFSGSAGTSVSPYDAADSPAEPPIWSPSTSAGDRGNRVRVKPRRRHRDRHVRTRSHLPQLYLGLSVGGSSRNPDHPALTSASSAPDRQTDGRTD